MIDAVLTLTGSGGARRSVQLSSCLDPADAERAAERAIGWIKQMRHAEVEGGDA